MKATYFDLTNRRARFGRGPGLIPSPAAVLISTRDARVHRRVSVIDPVRDETKHGMIAIKIGAPLATLDPPVDGEAGAA